MIKIDPRWSSTRANGAEAGLSGPPPGGHRGSTFTGDVTCTASRPSTMNTGSNLAPAPTPVEQGTPGSPPDPPSRDAPTPPATEATPHAEPHPALPHDAPTRRPPTHTPTHPMSSGRWAGSTRRSRLPTDWQRRRRYVLERDGHRCRRCGNHANQVDHIEHGDDHSLGNLQALCDPCHRTKSASEGSRAAHARRGTLARPPERHPGLR